MESASLEFFKLNFPDNLYTRFQNRQGKAPGRNGTQTSKLNMAIPGKSPFVFGRYTAFHSWLFFPIVRCIGFNTRAKRVSQASIGKPYSRIPTFPYPQSKKIPTFGVGKTQRNEVNLNFNIACDWPQMPAKGRTVSPLVPGRLP